MTEQRGPGRPSDYNEDIATTICDRLADGESLRAICASAGMPNKATVFRWIGSHEEFREQYQWARELQADDILGRILEIADDSSRDYVQKTGPDGNMLVLIGATPEEAGRNSSASRWACGRARRVGVSS